MYTVTVYLFRKCHRQEIKQIGGSMDQAGLWMLTDMYKDLIKGSD